VLDRTDNELYNSRPVGRDNLPIMWSQSDLSESDMKSQNCGTKMGYYERMKFRTSRFTNMTTVLCTVNWEHDISESELQWLDIGQFAVLSILIIFSYT
jgi:hypothetical protein